MLRIFFNTMHCGLEMNLYDAFNKKNMCAAANSCIHGRKSTFKDEGKTLKVHPNTRKVIYSTHTYQMRKAHSCGSVQISPNSTLFFCS